MNDIMNKMDLILNELDLLSDIVENYSYMIEGDLANIESQIDLMSETIKGSLDDNLLEDTIITEVSVEDIDTTFYGKITSSTNYATIEGEINVGGIAGNMSLENEQDPEDELSDEYSWRERKSYELKSILYKCTNKGNVISKKDIVGAICGQLDIGLISDCYGYGNVTSETGGYVGGIAGIAKTTIMSSVANSTLLGKTYVGGIVGTGYETVDGNSIVKDCYSMVEIEDCQQFEGAIAGTYVGNFENNYFVSDSLQGINRVSYAGIAERIPYYKLLEVIDIPEELEVFTLSFVVDGRVIKKVEFEYGEGFGPEIFPDVPKKDGYQGVWDITDLSSLYFDTVVTAKYTPYVKAISSDVKRNNGRPVYLIEGNFNSGDEIIAEMQDIESVSDEFVNKVKAIEYWHINFSYDGQKRHSLRFLPLENYENAKLYVRENSEWRKVETGEFGSYKTLQVVGNDVELLVVPIRYEIISNVLIGLAIVVVVGLILTTEFKKHYLLNGIKWFIGTYSIKKIMVVLLLLSCLGVFYITRLPQVQMSSELASIFKDVLTTSNQSVELDLNLEIGDMQLALDSNVYILNEGDKTIFVLEENGHSIYLCDSALILENGKAYRVETNTNRNLIEQIHTLYEATEAIKTEELDKTIYTIEAHEEAAEALMEVLIPSAEGKLANVKDTIVRIIAKDGILQSVEVEGYATLMNAMESEIKAHVVISNFSEIAGYEVPANVQSVISNIDSSSLSIMSEDMYRIIMAFVEFNAKEQEGTVSLDVSCGSINFELEQDWADFISGSSNLISESRLDVIHDIIYEICLNGEYSSEKIGNAYIYSMKLDDAAIDKLATSMVSDISLQAVDLAKGTIRVIVEDNEITAFEVDIDGTITVLLSEIDASIDAVFMFE